MQEVKCQQAYIVAEITKYYSQTNKGNILSSRSFGEKKANMIAHGSLLSNQPCAAMCSERGSDIYMLSGTTIEYFKNFVNQILGVVKLMKHIMQYHSESVEPCSLAEIIAHLALIIPAGLGINRGTRFHLCIFA